MEKERTPEESTEEIHLQVELPVPPAESFRLFTGQMNEWWPRQYTWSGEVLERIGMEPEAGGRCYEFGPHGFECDWGRVRVWEPSRRLVLCWQIGPGRVPQPDPERGSELELEFTPSGPGTVLSLTHRHFARHGENAGRYRAGLASSQGWPYILDLFKRAAEGD